MIPDNEKLALIYVIVNRGHGSKVLQYAKKRGLPGGTVFLGRGTIKNPLMEALALSDTRKEIVFLVSEAESGAQFLESLNSDFQLHKRNHGIAFMMNVNYVCGSNYLHCGGYDNKEDEEKQMYQAVYVIVDKGKGEIVVDAATAAGTRGATIINARGSGIHETAKLFNMEIEPEKEMVMIILKSSLTEQAVAAIRDKMDINRPGNGIMFVQNVSQVYGLFE